MSTIFIPAEPYPKKANDNIRSSDWNAAIDEVSRLSVSTQNLDRDTFNGPLTINGALTVNGILGVGGYTRISEAAGAGDFAAFGANVYVTAGGWNPVDTAYPGAGLLVGAQIAGTPEFRFFVMDAGGVMGRNIAAIGTEGLMVTGGINGPITVKGNMTVTGVLTASGGINGPITVEGPLTVDTTLTVAGAVTANAALTVKGALTASDGLAVTGNETVSGGLTVTGDEAVSGKLTVNGPALSELKGPVTVSGLLTASNGLTVNVALLTANKGLTVTGGLLTAGAGLTVTGNETVSGGLTVTGDETISGKLTVNGTTLSELKGPVTVSGLLTASNGLTVNVALLTANKGLTVTGGLLTAGAGLTVTGNQTVSGTLTVSGALTASGGINGLLTVNGALKVGSTGGMLEVGSLTIISQNTAGSWSAFGKNFYLTENGSWVLKDTSKPGVNFHMSADGADNKEFRFVRRDVGSTENILLATIGTGGLTVTGGINGPITVKGDLTIQGVATVGGSFMSIAETTVLSANATGGPWASFGSNAYYRGNGWNLAKTNEAGVCLRMSGQGGGNSEFRFARVEANSNSATDLVTMGREGIVVHDGKKVATGHEFLYMIRGKVTGAGARYSGSGFSAEKTGTGKYKINFDTAFSDLPIAVATTCLYSDSSSTLENAVIFFLSYKYIEIKVGNSNGVGADRDFTFIAVGLRN